MLVELTSQAAYVYADVAGKDWGGWHGGGSGGPGWWLVFPVLFWAIVLSVAGYLIYRTSAGPSARRAAERTLAEGFARGDISEEEWRQRRSALRRRS